MFYETLFVGLVVTVIYIEIMDIYPGGIIVPAYMAFFLDHPLKILATVGIAFLSLGSYRVLASRMIIFGKRRFVLFILLGSIWSLVGLRLFPHLFLGASELNVIGWVIPGLLANHLERQRWIPTLASLFTVSAMTYFLVRILFWLGL